MIILLIALAGLVLLVMAVQTCVMHGYARRINTGLTALGINLLGCMLWENEIVGFVWNEGVKHYRGLGAFFLAISLGLCVFYAAVTAYNAVRLGGKTRFSRLVLALRCKSRAPGAVVGLVVTIAALAAANPVMLLVAENARGKMESAGLYGLLAAAVVLAVEIVVTAGLSAVMANLIKPRTESRPSDTCESAA